MSPGLVDDQDHAALSVHARDVDLRRKAVADVGHVPHINRRAIRRLDRHIVQRGEGIRRTVHLHVEFGRTHLTVPEGSTRFCVVMALITSIGDKPFGLQRRECQCSPKPGAVSRRTARDRRAGHVRQLIANQIRAEIEQLLLGEPLPLIPSCRTGTLDAE